MPKSIARKRLVLLDAHAIIHRAYHALPDFTGPSGEPTGALYGLSSMLLRLIDDIEPEYLAACYDLPGKTVRHEAYEAYKATRTKTDDALVTQIEGSRKIFKAFGIPLYERSGFEADDILGTIAHLLKNDTDVEVIIASGDMDTLQLIDGERVKVYTLKKGINDTILYDAEAVMERFGFPPERIPDYKGLRGDPSDNIKGVPGIGDKTATDLVVRFGSIDDIYNTLKKGESAFLDAGIKARTIRLLKEHEEDARFSTMIATIRTDAPIAFRLEDTRFHDGTTLPGILALFDELGFRSLRARAKNVLGETGETGEEEMEAEPTLLSETVSDERLEEARVMLWLLASDFTNPSLDDILAYAREDSFDAAYEVLQKKLKETGRLFEVYEKIEQPLIPILKEMKMHGVLVDKKMLDTLSKTYGKELETIEARIVKAAGREFNISSPKQLGEVLFDELGLSVKGQKKTSTGQRSTRESELEKLQDLHPIVADVLEYREVQKLLSTYIEALPPLLDSENRLHADFIQTGTTTGRMASANPNLQNIPIRTERGRLIRNAFIAPRGFRLVALDYSQIELRLAAILSKDEKLCEIFKSGRDVHKEVAARVFKVRPEEVDAEMRRRAKAINFGILYGMGANALRVSLNSTMAEAHEYLEGYFNTFKTLSAYIETTKGFARKHGYTETMFGRRREFPGIRSPLPYVRAQAERMAINAPMQGTQSDIIKLAMVRIDEHLRTTGKRDEAHLLLQVHDELVYELHEEHSEALAKDIKQIMESVVSLKETGGVPIIVEAKEGANWGEMAPLAL
jgi:DNA polymerase-1